MPTYTCTAAEGLLTPDQKAAVADAITRAHAEITGAPAYFAQVIFQPVAEGDHFMGGKPLSHDSLFVHGHIRAGRAAVDRKALVERLIRDVAQAAGRAPFSVWVYLSELPSAAMAEFGHILPEPGGEAAWETALPPAEKDRMKKL